MDKSMIERYKSEMLKQYRLAIAPAPVEPVLENSDINQSSGRLVGIVTTLRNLYPVPKARVTVFEGTPDNMKVIATDWTDESGRTEIFVLPAPDRAESQSPSDNKAPYANYNMMVEAEGYISNIHLNIPVFSGVTSLQRSNMLLLETAGENKGPQIFDEAEKYDL